MQLSWEGVNPGTKDKPGQTENRARGDSRPEGGEIVTRGGTQEGWGFLEPIFRLCP